MTGQSTDRCASRSTQAGEIRTPGWHGTTRLRSTVSDRILVDVAVEKARAGGISGRLMRRVAP